MICAFADTSFYMALFSRRDQWHRQATDIIQQIDAKIITTEYVLVELGAAMRRGNWRQAFSRFVADMAHDVDTEVLPSSTTLFRQGVALFAERKDKEWSLTDCISFVVMEQQGITEALTSDRHFEQAGFRILLNR